MLVIQRVLNPGQMWSGSGWKLSVFGRWLYFDPVLKKRWSFSILEAYFIILSQLWSQISPLNYNSWKKCQTAIKGIAGAQYMSFETLKEAKVAYNKDYKDYIGTKKNAKKTLTAAEKATYGEPNLYSIALVTIKSNASFSKCNFTSSISNNLLYCLENKLYHLNFLLYIFCHLSK